MDVEVGMALFRTMAAEGHEAVVFFSDPSVGLRCVIAIHDTTLGPALGGTRMWPYATEAEALTDALRLSKAMTYKAALAGLDLGGGKAVIIGDPARDKTEALLRAYGRAVDSLGGRYITASDVGTTPQDLEIIMQETRWMLGRPRESGGSGDSAPATAYGVLQAMHACADDAFGDPSLSGRTVVIQGFGKVASNLARRLKDEGAELVVAEIASRARDRAAEEFHARIVRPDEIYDVEGDIFAPCALGGVLNDSTIPRLRCRIVAGSANNQLAERADADRLEAADILYAPDYAINAGGIINLSFELATYEPEIAMARVAKIHDTMAQVIAIAKNERLTTAAAADWLAEARLSAARAMAPRA